MKSGQKNPPRVFNWISVDMGLDKDLGLLCLNLGTGGGRGSKGGGVIFFRNSFLNESFTLLFILLSIIIFYCQYITFCIVSNHYFLFCRSICLYIRFNLLHFSLAFW